MFETLKTEATSLKLRAGAAYFSVVHLNGIYHIFWRYKEGGHSITSHAASKDGLKYGKVRFLFVDTHMAHNFHAFLDRDQNISGVGGLQPCVSLKMDGSAAALQSVKLEIMQRIQRHFMLSLRIEWV